MYLDERLEGMVAPQRSNEGSFYFRTFKGSLRMENLGGTPVSKPWVTPWGRT